MAEVVELVVAATPAAVVAVVPAIPLVVAAKVPPVATVVAVRAAAMVVPVAAAAVRPPELSSFFSSSPLFASLFFEPERLANQ